MLLSVALNGLPIIVDALKGILVKRINVDELVSIAIVACLIDGHIRLVVQKTGEDATLGRIVQFIQDAERFKSLR